VPQTSHRGVATPYCPNNCLAWYSWIFMAEVKVTGTDYTLCGDAPL